MYELSHQQAGVIVLGLVMICAACYGLGYQAADAWAKVAVRHAKSQLSRVEKRERELGKWVQENWPNEYAAYRHGQTEGIQQGIDIAHDALREDEAA